MWVPKLWTSVFTFIASIYPEGPTPLSSSFALFRSSTDWVGPKNIEEGNLSTQATAWTRQRQPHRHTRNPVWPNVWASCGFDKGIYKIIHHNSLGSDQICPFTVTLCHFTDWGHGVSIMVSVHSRWRIWARISHGAEEWTKVGNARGPRSPQVEGGYMNVRKLWDDHSSSRDRREEWSRWESSVIEVIDQDIAVTEWMEQQAGNSPRKACWESERTRWYTGHLRNAKEELRLPVNNSRKPQHGARDSLGKGLLEKAVCIF